MFKRAKEVAGEVKTRLRDRRRKERQRLEEMFDRKTFTTVFVLGTASKVMETLFIPIIALEPVRWNVATAYVLVFLFSVGVGVYWKELADTASAAADAAEDAVSSE